MIRKSIISAVISAVCCMSFVSCDGILKEEPMSFVDPGEYFKTEAECKAAINYLYSPLYGFYRIQLMYVTDLSTDLAYFNGHSDPAVYFALSPASPGTTATAAWTNCYKGIVQSNNVIDCIKRSPLSDEMKSPLLGEATFMRTFYYYLLTSLFGDVPFFFDPVFTTKDQDRVGAIPRMDAYETREALIKDLLPYVGDLPSRKPEDSSMQHANREAAYMLLAKLAMWNSDFGQAKEYLLKVRDVYGILNASVYKIEDTYLSKKNVPENIFEVQYSYNPAGLQKNSGISMYMTPAVAAGTDIFDGIQIPFIGKKSSISGSAFPTEYLIGLYEKIKSDLGDVPEGRDPRSNIILAYDYNGKVFDRVARGEKPWFGIKFWCPNMDNTADGNSPRVFRYADAVLMLAECYNALNDPDQALALLKEVRTRVGYTRFFEERSKKAILKEIQEERARELMGDFQRKFDLVRWGIFYESVKMNADIPLIKGNIKPCHKFLPIPDTEVIRTDGILTNDDYQ